MDREKQSLSHQVGGVQDKLHLGLPGVKSDTIGSQTIQILCENLSVGILEEQRAAAGELHLLAKRNADNRICIAEAGAIPLLVNLLSTPDGRTQEHAVTALLNLSIYENNKGAIVMAGAIAPIVEVLKNGSMEARENAAATLFSLSVVDENKITIGASGAIPALVGLLREGSQRGKKDAATALFNLSIYQGNKARAVRAGVVAPLMQLLVDPSAGMVDEALAILAILASHQEGKIAIGNADAIPILVDIIRTGSPRNRENAAAVLLALCINDPQNLIVIKDLGALEPLTDLAQMSDILRRLKDLVLTENPEIDAPDNEKGSYTCTNLTEKSSSPVIPDDFRCPISLELMKDPVIVATGQTYERACIQAWLDSGYRTCPKTQQMLPHIVLTPNYELRSLIALWCESNGIELPKRSCSSRCGSVLDNSGDRATVDVLLQKQSVGTLEEQRAAAGELRLLARRKADNRICIAEAGGIPLLVNLLSTPDARTQEHAVTALLNLFIYVNNKGAIVMAGAIAPIVEVLKNGSMEARENAAATLFSLSVVDENKITIGASGAIPALIGLLREGSQRGKKDAATELFNLSIYQDNKEKAVRAGVVAPLFQLLVDPSAGMVDEALAILSILVSYQEGKIAIGNADAMPILVDITRTGSPRNQENAAAVLLALCTNDPQNLILIKDLRALEPLTALAQNGTARAKKKAISLLEHMNKPEQLPSSQS